MEKPSIDPRIVIAAVVAGLVVLALLVIGNVVGILDREATLRNQEAGQQRVVETYADKAWKIVAQQAQVPPQYKKDFLEVYSQIMRDRYPVDGSAKDPLLKFVAESNPQYDSSLYVKLMTAIEAQRAELTNQEKLLVSIDVEHNAMFDRVWTGIVLRAAGREKTEIKVLSSDRTRDMLDNGENDISIYGE